MTVPATANSSSLEVNPAVLPWSCRGSYLCLAVHAGQNGTLTTGKDICLVSHNHAAGLPIFAIRPLVDGSALPKGFPTSPSAVDFHGSPSIMQWKHDGNVVAEAVFASPTSLRLRGSAPLSFSTQGSLKVDAWRCWLFSVPPRRGQTSGSTIAEFTSTPNTAVRFECLKGSMQLEGQAPFDPMFHDNNRRVIIHPGANGTWELEITERDHHKAETHGTVSAFKKLVDSREQEFESYLHGLCPWADARGSDEQVLADEKAAYVMWASTVSPRGFIPTEAVLMSKLWMNKVWSWDNCFNGLALSSHSIDRALEQILLPFQYMTPSGRLPDSITTSEVLFDYLKPPIYGWTFNKLLQLLDPSSTEDAPAFGSLSRGQLQDVYDKVSRFTAFWLENQQCEASELPWYSHGNDSGWDNSTAFDRQTVCVAPDLAAFMVGQCDFLAKLATHLGDTHAVTVWAGERDRIRDALVRELWSDEHKQFLFKNAHDGSTWSSTTLLRLVPLVAHRHLPEDVVEHLVSALDGHMTEWGLATEEITSKLYEPDGYWRGPIWAPPTIMIESSLRQAGYTAKADQVRDKFFRLCAKAGFAENYDAVEGMGNRDLSYTWSASAYLVMRREATRRR